MDKEMRKITDLHEWKDNPRSITAVDFERLKRQITKLGQYKPLLVTKDGEVIGGNMRLKAYKALGITDVWVSVVEPKDENEKMEYALSDNDRAGFYDADTLANIMPNYQIDWKEYAIDLNIPSNIEDILKNLGTGAINVDEMWKDMPEYGDGALNKPFRTVFVHFQKEIDVQKFAQLLGQVITEKTKWVWYPFREKQVNIDKKVISEEET